MPNRLNTEENKSLIIGLPLTFGLHCYLHTLKITRA